MRDRAEELSHSHLCWWGNHSEWTVEMSGTVTAARESRASHEQDIAADVAVAVAGGVARYSRCTRCTLWFPLGFLDGSANGMNANVAEHDIYDV